MIGVSACSGLAGCYGALVADLRWILRLRFAARRMTRVRVTYGGAVLGSSFRRQRGMNWRVANCDWIVSSCNRLEVASGEARGTFRVPGLAIRPNPHSFDREVPHESSTCGEIRRMMANFSPHSGWLLGCTGQNSIISACCFEKQDWPAKCLMTVYSRPAAALDSAIGKFPGSGT